MFQTISQYWVGPILNFLLIIVLVRLFLPMIKQMINGQLSSIAIALTEAKRLPEHTAELIRASESLSNLNRDISDMISKTDVFDRISEQFGILNRRIDDLQRVAEERPLTAMAETVVPLNHENAAVDLWQSVADMWFEVKDHVEAIILAIPDGRRRRVFDRLPRYRYDDVVSALLDQGLVSQTQAEAINEMDDTFRSIRNRRRTVTPEMLRRLSQLRSNILSTGQPTNAPLNPASA